MLPELVRLQFSNGLSLRMIIACISLYEAILTFVVCYATEQMRLKTRGPP
jgi:hypothetical protein